MFSAWSGASAQPCGIPRPFELDRVNRRLAGHVVDHTNNHGTNNAIWSPALGEYRDMYVYLPPGYDPCKKYPIILSLHPWGYDEHAFLCKSVQYFDDAMRTGRFPPAIVAVPDGSIKGKAWSHSPGSFFLNTPVGGRFEDYLMEDVWSFLITHYPIRPEREAHVVAGVSMGGMAAFHTGIKYKDHFGVVVGFVPLLNRRWEDCHGNILAPFDPDCWGWRTDFTKGRHVFAIFYHVIPIPEGPFLYTLYGRGNPDTLGLIIRDNPIEMLDAYDIHDGDLAMYIAYAGRDQFGINAQVESFLYHACQRGIHIDVDYDPQGRHDKATVVRMAPAALDWMAQRLAPYPPE
jgi:S-formylglutathione hydrolase FrmB